ncbi:MAG: beta-Ala-His dipeptidase [Succinivibrio sp.]
MITNITKLEPNAVWTYFNEITKIPHPSAHEQKLADFLCNFAREHGHTAKTDAAGNVIIEVSPTEDKKDSPLVILQGHMDMVPVAADGYDHDFLTEAVKPYVEGGFVKADRTTLGADNGIALAICMAIMTDNSLSHGPLRMIFTVEEETTMKGASSVAFEDLKGDYLINLDSEDNGYLFVNCAGSYDINIKFNSPKIIPENTTGVMITLSKLSGGHSGADIHLGHANALKVLSSMLNSVSDEYDFFLQSYSGGIVRNAIPAKAQCVVAVPDNDYDGFISAFKQCFNAQKQIYSLTDPHMEISFEQALITKTLGYAQTLDFIHFIQALPSGIIRMSKQFEGIVETSINLGVASTSNECINLSMLARSLNSTALSDIIGNVKALCYLLDNVEVEEGNRHEPWASPSSNRLIDVLNESYQAVTGEKFKITALHAGVECANFAKANSNLQLISIGPTILNPHSPMERVDIKGVEDIYLTLSRALAML